MKYISSDDFIQIALDNMCDPRAITSFIRKEMNPKYALHTAVTRLANLRRKGLLPLDSGNAVSTGELLKGTSTLYDSEGVIKQQWVKTDVSEEARFTAMKTAIESLCEGISPLPPITSPTVSDAELATVYISNDVHLGLLVSETETGESWDLDKGIKVLQEAYDYLFANTPKSKVGIVVDLGDLTEADGFRNSTSKSGNPLDLSARFPDVLRAAYRSLIYGIELALTKHEIVYFYNVEGNHDNSNSVAIREIIRQTFKDNPRVIVQESNSIIQYHHHGKTLIGFAHGDALKMSRAGETMAVDNAHIFSETKHRFFQFGHTHVDAVKDTPICRCESHRNLPVLNAWAHGNGYRRGIGTMKAITYSNEVGEVSRNIFNVTEN